MTPLRTPVANFSQLHQGIAWKPADRAELEALSQEADPELRAEALVQFAGRLEAEGRAEEAARCLESLQGDGVPENLRLRAERRLAVLRGGGSVGQRAEFWLRRLPAEASDPAMLAAMVAGGALFRVTRLATLSRLAAVPEAGLWTRGFGARAVAGLAGFAIEAPAFSLSARLANSALGREQEWGAAALGRDLASSYLVLGGLRAAGWASVATYARYAGPVRALREGPLRALFQQTGLLTGILLGHRLEQWAGLRAPNQGNTLVDSLALLLQFHVAGRLTRHAFGPRLAAWEAGLDRQAQRITPLPSPGDAFAAVPVFAMAGGPPEAARLPASVWMAALHEGGGGRPDPMPTLPEAIRAELRERIGALRERITAADPKSVEAARWIEEAEWLETVSTEEPREFFSSLMKLRAFYSRNMRLTGREGVLWMEGMQGRLAALIHRGNYFPQFIQMSEGSKPRLVLPHVITAPSTLWGLPENLGPAVSVNAHDVLHCQDYTYFRIEDLGTKQEVVSEGKVAEYRAQVRDAVNFPRPIQVGFDARQGRYYLLDGHHRSLAAQLEGRTHVLGWTQRHYPVGRSFHGIAELRQVSREEYERVAALNDYGAGMSESMQIKHLFDAESDGPASGGGGPETRGGGVLGELWKRVFPRR